MEKWMYCSFATDEKFLGAVIVQATGVCDAICICFKKGINPGGQMVALEIPDTFLPPPEYRDRLLTKEDILKLWPDAKSLGEYEKETECSDNG